MVELHPKEEIMQGSIAKASSFEDIIFVLCIYAFLKD